MTTFTKRIDELDVLTTIDQSNDRVLVMDSSDGNKLKSSSPSNFSSQIEIAAEKITSGTLPDGRFPAVLPAISGANLTNLSNLDASELSTGTIPDGRFPATLPAVSGANLTNLDASDLASGTIPDARFPLTLPALNGSLLTNLNGSAIASGTVSDDRIASTIARNKKTIKSLSTGTLALSSLADNDKLIVIQAGAVVTVEVNIACQTGDIYQIVNLGGTLTISADAAFTGYYTDSAGSPMTINPSTSISPGTMSAPGFVATIYIATPASFILDARNL